MYLGMTLQQQAALGLSADAESEYCSPAHLCMFVPFGGAAVKVRDASVLHDSGETCMHSARRTPS